MNTLLMSVDPNAEGAIGILIGIAIFLLIFVIFNKLFFN